MDRKTTDWSLIAKHIEGLEFDEENQLNEEFQSEFKECQSIWKKAKQIGDIKRNNEEFSKNKLDSCLSLMKDRIDKAENTSQQLKPQKTITFPFKLVTRIAAAILLVLTVGFAVLQYTDFSSDKTVITYTTFKTSDSEKKVVALPDGTKVWLNSNSSLLYGSNFDEQRNVTLEGEGYFDVISNPSNPFVVETNGVYTKVLGTSFNLKAYESESIIRMTVVEGKVEFGAKNQKLIPVEVNQEAIFNKTLESVNKTILTTPATIAWKEDRLAFNGVTLQEVAGILNRHYHTNIILQGHSLDSLDFSTTSSMDFNDKSLKETLDIITLTLGVSYQETENGFIIIP